MSLIFSENFIEGLCNIGPYSVTGEDPRLKGMFHNCGFNSAGLMLSGGCSEQLASWILQGQPDLHMYSYDIRYVRYRYLNIE